ncbi:sensor histidine kinase [Edaphobacter aggregans]|uniref:sensor histidine kinase n=1 Tax=Edaphobacter aggregans TaxID=570835 RepID=UPI00068EC785|nr:ATP-binding protein [Edaphobacter aggregans]
MRSQIATQCGVWVKGVGEKTLHAHLLNIGPRLILCFAIILLAMFVGNAMVLWQFHEVRAQAERLNGIDQKLVAVLRLHTSLMAFYDRMEELAHSEDAARLAAEAGPLRTAVLEEAQRARSALSLLPSEFQLDPTILPTLQVLQGTLPSQLEKITSLATSGDWLAVRLRLANQIRPLKSLTSALVEKVDYEVGEEQAQTVEKIKRVERRVFLIVPMTAVVTLLIAATLGLTITRSITQPLERLVKGSEALARGEFQHQVSVSGEDELAHLSRVFNDTTVRLRDLYANLQKSEDRLRLVIDTIPAMVWSARPDGSLDFVNQRWVEYTGLSSEDVLGWNWREVVHPDDIERFVREWRTTLASGEPMRTEVRVRAADGEYRWWLVRNVPLRDEDGNIVKWYGSSTDIEDRKRAEQLQADLAHINRVSTMGELTASLAHEIKQPIAATVANANACLLWLEYDRPDLNEIRDAAKSIVAEGTRASEIIENLRSLYKNSPPKRELVDVNEIVHEMVVLLRGEANRYAVSMRTDLAVNLPKITADGVQLQQVLMNLMLNGIEAMKETGGVLTVKSQLGRDGRLLISVSDTGVGLPDGKTDLIFNAFFTTKPQGSGMGLAISRSIIELHGGRLWATANDGRGATFQFTLPAGIEVVNVTTTGT